MFSNLFNNIFSKLFSKTSVGISIDDDSIKFVKLLKKKGNIYVALHGEIDLPKGLIVNGEIKDIKEFDKIIYSLKKKYKIKSTHLSLLDKNHFENYAYLFKSSRIKIKSVEEKALSIYRALVPKGSKDTHMIIDFNKNNSHLFIFSKGNLFYNAELGDAIHLLKDEIEKHFIFWHKQKDKREISPIKNIILSGGEAMNELADYLSVNLKNKVDLGNVWQNIVDTKKHIPPIDFKKSLHFGVTLGVALKGINE